MSEVKGEGRQASPDRPAHYIRGGRKVHRQGGLQNPPSRESKYDVATTYLLFAESPS